MKRILLLVLFFLDTFSAGSIAMHNQYTVIYDLSTQYRDELHGLYQKMWWSHARTRSDVDTIINHSLPIGLIDKSTGKLIGFTRIVSDHFKYAFIFDVLLEESYRGKGLGRLLMDTALNHPELHSVSVFELHCLPDMVPFYEKCGFKEDFENLKALRLKKVFREHAV